MYCECEVSEEESVNYVNFARLIREREREMILETIREIEEEREKQEEIERKKQKEREVENAPLQDFLKEKSRKLAHEFAMESLNSGEPNPKQIQERIKTVKNVGEIKKLSEKMNLKEMKSHLESECKNLGK